MTYTVRHARDLLDELSPEWLTFAEQSKNHVTAKVVLYEDRPLAIGTIYHNSLHPNPRHFDFLLADGAPADCLTPLLDVMVRTLVQAGSWPIHISVPERNRDVIAWAESEGFLPIRTTHIGVLNPPVARWEPLPNLSRLVDHDTAEMRRSLAILHEQVYRRQHAWNPPAPILPEMAEAIFLESGELLPEYLWFSVDSLGRPTGFASLRKTSTPQVLDFGWIGVLPDVHENVHRALFSVAVSAVKDHHLLIEVDDNDELTLQCFGELPVVWRESLLRYERAVDATLTE